MLELVSTSRASTRRGRDAGIIPVRALPAPPPEAALSTPRGAGGTDGIDRWIGPSFGIDLEPKAHAQDGSAGGREGNRARPQPPMSSPTRLGRSGRSALPPDRREPGLRPALAEREAFKVG